MWYKLLLQQQDTSAVRFNWRPLDKKNGDYCWLMQSWEERERKEKMLSDGSFFFLSSLLGFIIGDNVRRGRESSIPLLLFLSLLRDTVRVCPPLCHTVWFNYWIGYGRFLCVSKKHTHTHTHVYGIIRRIGTLPITHLLTSKFIFREWREGEAGGSWFAIQSLPLKSPSSNRDCAPPAPPPYTSAPSPNNPISAAAISKTASIRRHQEKALWTALYTH